MSMIGLALRGCRRVEGRLLRLAGSVAVLLLLIGWTGPVLGFSPTRF